MSGLRFIVMGDLHNVRIESHNKALHGQPHGITEVADITRNYWMTQNVLPDILSNIASLRPDFVIQTGDFVHGHCDNEAAALKEMEDALGKMEQLGCPVYFALGTHDGIQGTSTEAPVVQCLFPSIANSLKKPINKGYYTFVAENTLFIILDYTTFVKDDEQALFLKGALEESQKYQHVFVFAHPPIVPIGRPFFSSFDFSNTLLSEFACHPIDAYFCGHTHNQVASLHKIGKHWIPQLKSSILGYPDRTPVPLKDVRPLLPDLSLMEYGWGFLEDSCPGWWLVNIDGQEVQADWYVLNKGIQGTLVWRTGERAQFIRCPSPQGKMSFSPGKTRIHAVRMRIAGSNCRKADAYKISLNGYAIGALPPLEYFDCRQFVTIDAALWPFIKKQNHVQVTTSTEPMCVGGFVLEIETEAGIIRSSVSPFYTNTSKWDNWKAESLHHVAPSETIHMNLMI